jgi:hypothetical protein
MMELLLAMREQMRERMDANTKATLATLEMANEIREDIQARTKAMEDKRMKAEIYACISDIKNDRNETTAYQDAMEANLVKMEPNPGEKVAAVELQEIPNEDVAIYSLRKYRKETMACQGTMDARLESESEHREVPNEDAVLEPAKGRKMRRRGRKQAAGRRGEPKELTVGECGSRKQLAAACRKVSRRATVAWRKRNIFRKSRTQGNCGPRQELAAGRNMTRRAGMAQREGNLVREYSTRDNIAPRTRRGRTYEKRLWRGPECSNDIRDRGLKQKFRGSKQIKDSITNVIEGWGPGERVPQGSGGTRKDTHTRYNMYYVTLCYFLLCCARAVAGWSAWR